MLSFLPTKKKGDAMGDLDGWIYPFSRFSLMNSMVAIFSLGVSG